MFELRCIVADKKLAELMHAIEGLVLDTHLGPAQLADELNHKEKATGAQGNAAQWIDLFIQNTKAAGGKTVSAKQLTEQMKMHGFEARSYTYRVQQLLKDKVLKKTKQLGVYEVVR